VVLQSPLSLCLFVCFFLSFFLYLFLSFVILYFSVSFPQYFSPCLFYSCVLYPFLIFPFTGTFLSIVIRGVLVQKSLHCNLRNNFVIHTGFNVPLCSSSHKCRFSDLQNTFRCHGYSENILTLPTYCRMVPVLQAFFLLYVS
jgi:hypothetical protein